MDTVCSFHFFPVLFSDHGWPCLSALLRLPFLTLTVSNWPWLGLTDHGRCVLCWFLSVLFSNPGWLWLTWMTLMKPDHGCCVLFWFLSVLFSDPGRAWLTLISLINPDWPWMLCSMLISPCVIFRPWLADSEWLWTFVLSWFHPMLFCDPGWPGWLNMGGVFCAELFLFYFLTVTDHGWCVLCWTLPVLLSNYDWPWVVCSVLNFSCVTF